MSSTPRPARDTQDIINLAIRRTADNVVGQVEKNVCRATNLQLQRHIADILTSGMTGSDIANALKEKYSKYYFPDEDFVEALEMFEYYKSDAHAEAVRSWVEEVGFTPAFKKGEIVQVEGQHSAQSNYGPVVDICHDEAEYVIDLSGQKDGGGYVIAAERVKAHKTEKETTT